MQEAAESARRDLNAFSAEFRQGIDAWVNGLRSGQSGQWQSAVEDTLRRWRQRVEGLRTQTDMLEANDVGLSNLESLVGKIMSEKDELERLRSKAATRAEQADSLNPKERPSPSVNILGLQRTFRDSTRWTILALSIFFGLLALVVLGLIVWQTVVAARSAATAAPPGFGGSDGRTV